jgi:DNA helicase II / ATP-dependent DNA helicase PcrA
MPIHADCPKRAAVIACPGHALVLGGPGSGKTTVALRKAVARIEAGLKPGQTVLFVSFSRAAVARVIDAAKLEVGAAGLSLLDVETFHSFFWRLLRPHAYLLGLPRKLSILLPHDERALRAGIEEGDNGWDDWINERDRLLVQEGRMAFDLFAPKAAELLARCQHLPRLVAAAHPLIVIDEAQDTSTDAWRCVDLLARHTQVVCLADLDQQIYDFLPGVGPERVAEIRASLEPFETDLGSENRRSPDSEILAFANDILANKPRGAPYRGVHVLAYNPGRIDWNVQLRWGMRKLLESFAQNESGERPTIAVLTDNGRGALAMSKALSALGGAVGSKPIAHKLHFDESEALLYARLVAFLLEPETQASISDDIATALELIADARRSTGTGRKDVESMLGWSDQLRKGNTPRGAIVGALRTLIAGVRTNGFRGDPAADWLAVRNGLAASGHKDLVQAAQKLSFVVAFQRGDRIAANLSAAWLRDGAYTRAREALDAALAQDHLLDATDVQRGVHVMNIHKSKGKQFDGVILVRAVRHTATGLQSSFVWWHDEPPYVRSRKLLRVALTRARQHVVILDPHWPACPLLHGHRLA